MKIQLRHLVPSPLELAGSGFLAVVILLLANSKRLLSYYDLSSSNELIKSNADSAVSQALKVVDSFSATAGVVTFLIWAVVGVLCFGIVEALGHAYQEIKLQKQVSSKNYVKPATFSPSKFWGSVVAEMLTLVAGLGMLAAASLLFVLFVLPLGLAYSRVFLFDTSLANTLYLVLGLAVVFFGLLVLNVMVRFLLNRRRILGLR